MAKRKDLKTGISYLCTELISETVATSLYDSRQNQGNILSTINAIIRMRKDYLSRVSHVEPGMKPKLYFKSIKDSFMRDYEEMLETISNLHE